MKENSIARVSKMADEMTRKVIKRLCEQMPRYIPPPPKKSYIALVRYVYRGRGKLLPYPLRGRTEGGE